MTWPLTLAEPQRAGANSKPHHSIKKNKKRRTFRKHGFLQRNNLKNSDKKEHF